MGHSTVSFTRKGKLDYSQIMKEFEAKSNADTDKYGYSENPDSFGRAAAPSKKYLGQVYTYERAWNIEACVKDYESICLYYLPQEVIEKVFKSQYKKINALKEKIHKKTVEIQNLSSSIIKDSPLVKKTDKPVFVTVPCCNSKVNATAMYNGRYYTPRRCPVCNSDHNGQFEALWSDRALGKAFGKKRIKFDNEIKKLNEQISEIKRTIPEYVDEATAKKYAKEIMTLVAADVHH